MKAKITYDEINTAYEKLPEDEQAKINKLAQQLEMNVRSLGANRPNNHKVQFGRKQSLELLAKLGVWMNEEEV